MDGSAVTYSPEYYLVELGMVKRGDLYALRSFCERKERLAKDKDAEERKQFLIEKMKRKKVKHTGGPESQSKNAPSDSNNKHRKFEIGWMQKGNVVDFSLQSYFELHKLTRVNLYLRTRNRGVSSIPPKKGKPEVKSETHGPRKESSLERAKLIRNQDEEYAVSLRADREKTEGRERVLKEELKKIERLKKFTLLVCQQCQKSQRWMNPA